MKTTILLIALFVTIPARAGLLECVLAIFSGGTSRSVRPVEVYSEGILTGAFHSTFAPKAQLIAVGVRSGCIFSSNITTALDEALRSEENPLISEAGLQRSCSVLLEAVELAFKQSVDAAMATTANPTIMLISLFGDAYHHRDYPVEHIWTRYAALKDELYNHNEYNNFLDYRDNLLEERLHGLKTAKAYAALIRNLSISGPDDKLDVRRNRLLTSPRTAAFYDGVELGLSDLKQMKRANRSDRNMTDAIAWVRRNLR